MNKLMRAEYPMTHITNLIGLQQLTVGRQVVMTSCARAWRTRQACALPIGPHIPNAKPVASSIVEKVSGMVGMQWILMGSKLYSLLDLKGLPASFSGKLAVTTVRKSGLSEVVK